MVLVDWTIPVGPARVREVPSHAPLEEAFAAFARELTVVLAARFVPADHALDLRRLLIWLLCALGRRGGLCIVRGARLDRGVRGWRSDLRATQAQLACLWVGNG